MLGGATTSRSCRRTPRRHFESSERRRGQTESRATSFSKPSPARAVAPDRIRGMADVARLLKQNRAWAASRRAGDPHFFERLCDIQKPEFLWIGCADSRVPANEIVGLAPGELFVHRNVANI